MTEHEQWLPPSKVREYLDYHFDAVEEAQRQLYLAVMRGDIRARRKGVVFGQEWLKQISKTRFHDEEPFALPPDIELSVDDAKRLWA